MRLFVFVNRIKGRPKPIGFRSLFLSFCFLLLSMKLALAAQASSYLQELIA